MAEIRDIVKFTITELNLHKVEPVNEFEWELVNNYLLEQCKQLNVLPCDQRQGSTTNDKETK